MSEGSFSRKRRSLNIVAVAIIVYFLTGVEFGQGGQAIISIKYEMTAYALIWISFFYFWWRFYLYGDDVRRRWKLDYLYELSKNQEFRKLYSQPEGVSEHEPTVWVPALNGEGFRRYLRWTEAFLVGIRADDGSIQFADPSTFSDSINPEMQRWDVGPETVIPLKWRQYLIPAIKANLSAMTNKSGTEWALPNFLACIALILGISALMVIII